MASTRSGPEGPLGTALPPSWHGVRVTGHEIAVTIAGATLCAVTAKEKLRELVNRMSEREAASALVRLRHPSGVGTDRVSELLDTAPLDDEPVTPEEEEAVAEARGEYSRGEFVTADEAKRQLG